MIRGEIVSSEEDQPAQDLMRRYQRPENLSYQDI